MTTLRLAVKAVVSSRSDVGDQLVSPGDAVIIERGQPRWMMLKCPCGCGEEIPINLDRRAGKAWRYYDRGERGATLFPSVWRDTGCKSHFVIWAGRILLIDAYGDDDGVSVPRLAELAERVKATWPAGHLVSYAEVADRLDEIPWDVLEACRWLVSKGVLREGRGDQKTMFALL